MHTAPSIRLAHLFDGQRRAFRANPYPTAAERRKHLLALKRQLHRYQDVLAEAMSKDFGFRSNAESKMLDILGTTCDPTCT